MISDDSQIPATSVCLGDSYYFWTWTPPKSAPVEKCTLQGLENACRMIFRSENAFCKRFRFRILLPACMGSTISENGISVVDKKKFAYFGPKVASNTPLFGIVSAPAAPLAVPSAILFAS